MSQKKSSQKDDQETQADLGDIEELLEEAREQAASDEAQIPAGGTG